MMKSRNLFLLLAVAFLGLAVFFLLKGFGSHQAIGDPDRVRLLFDNPVITESEIAFPNAMIEAARGKKIDQYSVMIYTDGKKESPLFIQGDPNANGVGCIELAGFLRATAPARVGNFTVDLTVTLAGEDSSFHVAQTFQSAAKRP